MRYELTIALLFALVFATPMHAAISLVQVDSVTNAGGGNTIASNSLTITAGNLIVVFVRDGNTGLDCVTLADSLGNTWTAIDTASDGGSPATMLHGWYAQNATGGTDTITASFWNGGCTVNPWPSGYAIIQTLEYSGVATSGALDQHANTTVAGATSATLAVTTTSANEVVIGAFNTNAGGNTFTAFNSFTKEVTDSTGVMATEDQIVASTGTYTARMDSASSNTWTVVVGSFIASGGAPPVLTPHRAVIF